MKDKNSNYGDNPKIPSFIVLLEIEEFSSICEGSSNYMNNSLRLIYYDLLDDGTDKYRVYTIDSLSKNI